MSNVNNLADEISELRASIAALQHDRQVVRGKYAYILDPEFYEFMPVAARRMHSGKPLPKAVRNRIVGRYGVNTQRVYQPPPLHPVYKALGPALAARDKEICQLATDVAHCLRPLDKILTILPEIMEHRRGPEFKEAIETVYEMVFQTASRAAEQRVQHLAKLLKLAPGTYDERLIVDPEPFVDARDAHKRQSSNKSWVLPLH
ncbi:hypothetical protein GGF42_001073 [Coemansia sp. RSA 2424]|nr:hypothetical protein GGF42_001073 [Coemansia sp. RSA 2424]